MLSLLCHHSLYLSLPLSVCTSAAITPDPVWWNSGWRRLFFFSVLQRALIAGLSRTQRTALSLAGHTTLQLTSQQQQRQLQPSQLNGLPPRHPLTPTLCIHRNHLKRLQLNHYSKEGRKQRGEGGRRGRKMRQRKTEDISKRVRGWAWDK